MSKSDRFVLGMLYSTVLVLVLLLLGVFVMVCVLQPVLLFVPVAIFAVWGIGYLIVPLVDRFILK